MASPTSMPAFQDNQLVRVIEASAMEEGSRNLAGTVAASLLGVQSANAVDFPLTVTVSGMILTAGGAGGQKVLLNSANGPRLVDSIATFSQTVPAANATNPRQDLLCATYAKTSVSAGTSTFITGTGGSAVVSPGQPIFTATESCTFVYVQGTAAASPVDPAVPAGAVAVARISVAANATTLTSANITLLLISMQQQILSGIGGYVDLTSAQTITGSKTFSNVNNSICGLQLARSSSILSTAGIRLDVNGNVSIAPTGPGHVLRLGYDDFSLASINLGPNDAWGTLGSGGYTAPGSAPSTYGYNALVKGLVHAGPSALFSGPQLGDIVAERGDATGICWLGNTGTAYLYYDGASYHLYQAPLIINKNLNFSYSSLNVSLSGNNTYSISGVTASVFGGSFSTTSGQSGNVFAINPGGDFGIPGVFRGSGISAPAFFLGSSTLTQTSVTAGGTVGGQAFAVINAGSAIPVATIDTSGNMGLGGFLSLSASAISAYAGVSLIAAGSGSFGGSLRSSTTITASTSLTAPTLFLGSATLTQTSANAGGIVGGQALAVFNAGAPTPIVAIDTSGNMGLSGFLTLPASPLSAYSGVSLIAAGSGSFGGLLSSSTNITANGSMYATIVFSGGNTNIQAAVPPVYNQSGGNLSNSTKMVQGQTLVTGGSNTTVTLFGNAAFTSASTYTIVANTIFSGSVQSVQVNIVSGSQFTLNSSLSLTVNWIAIGF